MEKRHIKTNQSCFESSKQSKKINSEKKCDKHIYSTIFIRSCIVINECGLHIAFKIFL